MRTGIALSVGIPNTIDQRSPAGGRAWYALIVLFGVAVLAYTDRYILNVLIGGIRKDLGLSDVAISLAQGPAFAFVYGAMALVLGRAADRVNRKYLILAGLVIWSVGTASCAFASNFHELLLSRFVVGTGEAGLFPAAISMLADAFPPHRRGLALGVLFAGSALGSGMAVVAGDVLLAWLPHVLRWPMMPNAAPWRGVLLILASLGLPIVAFVSAISEPPRRSIGAAGQKHLKLREIVGHRAGLFIVILASLALIASADAAGTGWTPEFLVRNFAVSPVAIAATLGTVMLISGAAGNLLGGLVADRLEATGDVGTRLRGAALVALIAIPLSFYTFAPFAASVILFGALTFLINVVYIASSSAFLRLIPNEAQGLATATLAFVMTIGGVATGPILVALATDRVFHSPDKVGSSIALVYVALLLPAALLLLHASRLAHRAGRC